MKGLKHLVECHCVMPQYRKQKDPPYHQFKVFSLIDESDTVVPKHAKCNNCGVIHNVIDICKSEIQMGSEIGAVMDIKDCKLLLPSGICQILESYQCETPDWEHALFILQYDNWGDFIIVNREESENGDMTGKILKFLSKGQYRLEPFLQRRVI